MYLGLFIHVPGEGDGVVGDFFDVANGVEALLVISCKHKQRGGLFQMYLLLLKYFKFTLTQVYLCRYLLFYTLHYISTLRKPSTHSTNWSINDTSRQLLFVKISNQMARFDFYKITSYLLEQTNSKRLQRQREGTHEVIWL